MEQKKIIGAHLPADKTYEEMFDYANELNLLGIQFFSFSNRQWGIDKLVTDEKVNFFYKQRKENDDLFFVTHACYLINLASDDDELRKKSCEALLSEVKRCKQLKVAATIVHPGSNKNSEKGMHNISESLKWILKKSTI